MRFANQLDLSRNYGHSESLWWRSNDSSKNRFRFSPYLCAPAQESLNYSVFGPFLCLFYEDSSRQET